MKEITRDGLGLLRQKVVDKPELFESLRTVRDRINSFLRPLGISMPVPVPSVVLGIKKILSNYDKSLYNSQGKPKIIFFTPTGWLLWSSFEQLLGIALSLRGADCRFVICDAHLPLCTMGNIHVNGPFSMPCSVCMECKNDLKRMSVFPHYSIEKFLSRGIKNHAHQLISNLSDGELENFTYNDLPLGNLVKISVRHFLFVNDIAYHPMGMLAYRQFLYGAVLISEAVRNLLVEQKPDVVVCINGLFFEERIMRVLAEKLSIPVITYETGFLTNTVVFARGKAACDIDISDHWAKYAKESLTDEQERWLDSYLVGRQRDEHSVQKLWTSVEERTAVIRQQLHLHDHKKIITMFTNIVWDSAVQEKEVFFDSLFDWVSHMISFFEKQHECHLIIRIHPAEVHIHGAETIERLLDRINEAFPVLPTNISIIPAESNLSSYRLIDMSHAVLVYTSTIGLEAALKGKPVLTAAQTHYRHKGFTLDCETYTEYFALLNRLLNGNKELLHVDVEAARRYAYLFFKRHMIPFTGLMQETEEGMHVTISQLDDLQPGKNQEIDMICQFIFDSVDKRNSASLIID